MIKFIKPIKGNLIDIKQASDETFNKELLGVGFSIVPESNILLVPIDGVIEMIYPTKHTFSIKYAKDKHLLIHMGVDYQVNDQTFVLMFKLGDKVKRGTPLVKIDLDHFKKQTRYAEIYFTFVEENKLTIVEKTKENENDLYLLNLR